MRLFLFLILCSINCLAHNLFVGMGGQSNATGKVINPPIQFDNIYNSIMIYNGTSWVSYWTCKNSDYPILFGYAGIEISFAVDLIERGIYDSVFISKYCYSGSILCDTIGWPSNTWNVHRNGHWPDARTFYKSSLSNYQGHHFDNYIYFWWQGESDTSTPTCANAYQFNLTQLSDSIVKYVPLDAFYIIRLDTNILPTHPYLGTVRMAQVTIGNSGGIYHWIDSDSYPTTDGSHLTSIDYLKFGQSISRQLYLKTTYNVLVK